MFVLQFIIMSLAIVSLSHLVVFDSVYNINHIYFEHSHHYHHASVYTCCKSFVELEACVHIGLSYAPEGCSSHLVCRSFDLSICQHRISAIACEVPNFKVK